MYIRVLLGLYSENGKENGSYYLGLRVEGFGVTLGLHRGSLAMKEGETEATI